MRLASPLAASSLPLAVVVLGLAWANTAHATDVDVRIHFHDIAPDGRVVQRVRTVLTRMADLYERELGLGFPDPLVLDFTLVANQATYDAMAAEGGLRPGETVGFFGRATGGVVWTGAHTDAWVHTLVHEASHHLLHLSGARPPAWMNEGLSEVMEGARVSGNAVYLDPHPEVLGFVRQAGVPPLATLLASPQAVWRSLPRGPNGDATYSYGWALCAMMMSSRHGLSTLRAIATLRSRNPAAIASTVDARWPGGIAQLDRDFARWLNGSPTPLQLRAVSAETHTVQRPATCAGVMLRKGDEVVCVTP